MVDSTANANSAPAQDAVREADETAPKKTFFHIPESITWRTFLNARMFGFAFIRAWTYLMFLGMTVSFVSSDAATVLPPWSYAASTIALSLVLFGSAVFEKRFRALTQSNAFKASGPIAASLGTLAIALSALSGFTTPLLCLAGSIATGYGSGLIMLGYGSCYKNEDSTATNYEVPFSYFLAAGIFLVATFFPDPFPALVITALPLASGLILFVVLRTWQPETAPGVQPVPFDINRFALRIGAAVILISVADGIIRAGFIGASGTPASEFFPLSMFIGSAITMATIYFAVMVNAEDSLRSLYKIVVFAMAFVYLLLPVIKGNGFIECMLALTAYGTFNALIWLLLAEVASVYRLSSVTVFGIGWGLISIAALLESLAGVLTSSLAPFNAQMFSLFALIATVLVLASYLFVFREEDLIEMTSLESNERRDGTAGAEKGEESDEGASKAKKHILSAETDDLRPKFIDRCNEVAQEGKLSPKETEIMILYAKGHSGTRIQEELWLSRGTVTTHLRHIYQKLDIHNKQELLRLIEQRQSDK